VLVGRAAQVAQLRAAVKQAAAAQSGTVLLVEGDTGTGKTALLDVLEAGCRDAGFRVFRSTAFPLEQGLPFSALLSCGVLAGEDSTVGPAAHGAEALGPDRIAGTLEWALGRWTARAPVALLLDDAQWADPQSVDMLSRLAQARSAGPLLVAVATRQPCLPTRSGVPDLHVRLGPLDAAATAELAYRTAGKPVPQDRVCAAAGNPRYVIAEARAFAQEDGTDAARPGPGGEAAVTGPAEEILRELASLPDRARDVVEVASVLGTCVRLVELADVLGVLPEDVVAAAGEAVAQGVLHLDRQVVMFRHDLVHRTVLNSLSPAVLAALRHQVEQTAVSAAPAGGVRGTLV
jgi:predicted ATPase